MRNQEPPCFSEVDDATSSPRTSRRLVIAWFAAVGSIPIVVIGLTWNPVAPDPRQRSDRRGDGKKGKDDPGETVRSGEEGGADATPNGTDGGSARRVRRAKRTVTPIP